MTLSTHPYRCPKCGRKDYHSVVMTCSYEIDEWMFSPNKCICGQTLTDADIIPWEEDEHYMKLVNELSTTRIIAEKEETREIDETINELIRMYLGE